MWPFEFAFASKRAERRFHVSQLHEICSCFLFSGYKTFTNEFIAYERLSQIIDNGKIFSQYNGSYVDILGDLYLEDTNTTLIGGVMQVRWKVWLISRKTNKNLTFQENLKKRVDHGNKEKIVKKKKTKTYRRPTAHQSVSATEFLRGQVFFFFVFASMHFYFSLLILQDRSVVISTYALCGFANLSSIGMVIGALGALAPAKRSDISGIAFRAMVTGTVVSFMNACAAG